MDKLYFQGNKPAVLFANGNRPPLVFEGRILWVPVADTTTQNFVGGAGYELIPEVDQRYALAQKHGVLFDHILASAGLPIN
ncbi:MAG: hypothetical protein JZU50_08345 [Desulfobulbaceae bacterium]|jgi:hypothetical protein|nr:hypothetical protein [Desulfobulbaceae bacterium]